MLSCEFWGISKNNFYSEHLRATVSVIAAISPWKMLYLNLLTSNVPENDMLLVKINIPMIDVLADEAITSEE